MYDFFQRTCDILSYQNNLLQCLINYFLIMITFLASYKALESHRLYLYSVFVGLFAFQIGICFAQDCFGVSIVWNALVGLLLVNWTSLCKVTWASIVCSISADFAYAITFDAITSIAHACAIILGLILGLPIVFKKKQEISNQRGSCANTPTSSSIDE